jgi:hypothetical protein
VQLYAMSLFLAILIIYEKSDQAKGVAAEAYRLAARETVPLPAADFSAVRRRSLSQTVPLADPTSVADSGFAKPMVALPPIPSQNGKAAGAGADLRRPSIASVGLYSC